MKKLEGYDPALVTIAADCRADRDCGHPGLRGLDIDPEEAARAYPHGHVNNPYEKHMLAAVCASGNAMPGGPI